MMNIRRITRNIFFLLLILANIGCDQVSKSLVREHVNYQEAIPIIGTYLTLTNVENTGAFLSMGSDYHPLLKMIFLSILPLLVLLYGVYFLMTKKHIKLPLALGISFIIGGGIGNIYDRFLYGSVTDFLYINYSVIRTGVFNMADVSIVIGIGLMLINTSQKQGER